MTIKRQFIILSSTLIAIPILCTLFIVCYSYFYSPNRYYLTGTNIFENLDKLNFTHSDINRIKASIRKLPSDVQVCAILSDTDEILYSSIPELEENLSEIKIWNFINESSSKYFYQFSSPPLKNSKIYVITRVSRQREKHEKRKALYSALLLTVFLAIIASLILITLISRTIFKSIKRVEKSTYQLAEGNLNEIIAHENESLHGNELTAILQSLEKMRRELLEILERKNRFIMGISHDLRTPVAVIKGYSEAIKDGIICEANDIKDTFGLIDSKTIQLEQMIDTLINFMKLNNYEIKEQLVQTSITKIIKNFAKYAEITGTVFDRNIKTDIQIEKEIKVPLNSLLVQRSFENIFSNAIRYTKKNGVIELCAFINQTKNQKSIKFQIKDDGIGIAQKDIPHIFDMFYRGTNSRREEGMGIGLSVVKNIMDTHGWNITVTSQKGNGSCFTIEIPLENCIEE